MVFACCSALMCLIFVYFICLAELLYRLYCMDFSVLAELWCLTFVYIFTVTILHVQPSFVFYRLSLALEIPIFYVFY